MTQPHNRALAGASFCFAAAVGFSLKSILIKFAYAYHVDASTLLTLRMGFSLPFFLAMAAWSGRDRQHARLTRRQWGAVLGLGFIGYYLASYLDFLGLQYISAGLERLTLFLYPTIVLILSAVMFKRRIAVLGYIFLNEPLSGLQIFGAALVLSGVTFGNSQEIFGHPLSRRGPLPCEAVMAA